MSAPEKTSRGPAGRAWEWLLGDPRWHRRTARRRWLHGALTAGLFLTGLAAWALALLQPWKVPATAAVVPLQAPEPPGRVEAAAREAARLFQVPHPPALRPLPRDPFGGAGLGDLRREASPSTRGPEAAAPPAGPASGSTAVPRGDGPTVGGEAVGAGSGSGSAPASGGPSADAVARLVVGLRLEAVVLGPDGQGRAVIDGRVYRPGDRVADAEGTLTNLVVEAIRADRVVLRWAGVTCVLPLD